MKANELRIGNWVKHKGFADTQVESIHEAGINSVYDLYTGFEYIEPIPLTEEWLVRLGFQKLRDNLFYMLLKNYYSASIAVKLWGGKWVVELTVGSGLDVEGEDMAHIKYVHQLQNLHFALTGNELTP